MGGKSKGFCTHQKTNVVLLGVSFLTYTDKQTYTLTLAFYYRTETVNFEACLIGYGDPKWLRQPKRSCANHKMTAI